jgi:hypothetical protein
MFDQYSDTIDSHDIIERIDDLEAQLIEQAPEPLSEDEEQELADLHALAEEASASPDWQYGETLVRDSYFQKYAEQLADDIGAIPDNLSWPLTCIDWEQAARELKHDYMAVEYAGVTYWLQA